MKQPVLIAFVFLLMPIANAQLYSITDLGSLSPTAVNTWGQVVGSRNGHASIWTRWSGTRDLGTLPGGTFSSAAAINDLGVVTGIADGPGTAVSPYPGTPNLACGDLIEPVVWKKGRIRALGTLGFGFGDPDWCNYPFYPTAMNGLGQIVGYSSQYPNEFQWGFFWTNGISANLPVSFVLSANGMGLFGGSWPPTFSNAVSNTQQVVGQDGVFFTQGHATSWKNGVSTDLGSLAGSDAVFYSSSANSVNDLGQVVGWSTTIPLEDPSPCYEPVPSNCPIHAVVWTQNIAINDLGTLPGDSVSTAVKINLFGLVIGSSGNSVMSPEEGIAIPFLGPLQVVGRPFIWSKESGMRDLNTLIPSNAGWVLNSVSDLNVWGQIVGLGTLNGQPHGFLLTPRNL
jgi:uncharacterized membrane protein